MHILGFLLILILLVVLIPLLVIVAWGIDKYRRLKQKIMGGGSSQYGQMGNSGTYSGRSSAYGGTSGYSSGSSSQQTSSSSRQHGKIIPKDEGEYVDYEVVE